VVGYLRPGAAVEQGQKGSEYDERREFAVPVQVKDGRHRLMKIAGLQRSR
jgi:hypothetical protein